MSWIIGGVIFLILFAVFLVAISLGSRFIEVSGRKKVEAILSNKPDAESGGMETSILLDPEEGDPLHRFLEKATLTGQIQSWIYSAGLRWTASSFMTATAILAVVGGLLGWLLRPLGFVSISIVLFAFFLGGAPYMIVSSKRNKRMIQFEEQLPEALDFLARSMRAGHALSVSLELLGAESPDPLGQEFRALFNEQNLGAPLDVALKNFARRVPILDVKLFVSSVLLQRQTGGNLGEMLQRLAGLVRDRFRLRGQVKAASAHGRMTRIVLTVLPIVVAIALQFVAPGYLGALVEDPDGRWMILGSILGLITGYWVMGRITDIEV